MGFWKPFKHKLRRAGQLTVRDWLEMAGAWWLLLGFNLAVRWVALERLEKFTSTTYKNNTALPAALAWARHRQELISMAARLHFPALTCLPKALALRWKLSRKGIPAQLRIGTFKTSTGILAHAWVEVEGEAVGEPEDISERFKRLAPMEAKRQETH